MKYLPVINTFCALAAIFSCTRDPNSTGREYIPDMAHSLAYETYSQNPNFKDGMSARMPVKGTVARGHIPYAYPNTKEGYEQAGAALKNPVLLNDENLAEGKRLYGIYCTPCHGETGMADGAVVTVGGFPPPPAYNSTLLRNLPEGKIFHSITYGKLNTQMSAYSSQLNEEERWKVVHFVQTLQKPPGAAAAATDTTKSTGN